VTAIACLAAARPAPAFETLGAKWISGSVPFRINPNFPDHALAGAPEKQVEIILCAAGAWTGQSRADFEFDYRGTTTVARLNERDGINAVFWSNADGGEALAATIFAGQDGTALAFDIIFFGKSGGIDNRWSGPGEPATGTFDIQGVAVHELGHALGLDHTPIGQATMFASVSGRGLPLRTLHADDIAGVEFLYGVAGQTAPAVDITSVEPAIGPVSGGNEVLLEGINFTYESETQLVVGGLAVSGTRWNVETCGLLRITNMPSHAAGPVAIKISNSIGEAIAEGSYRYGGEGPRLIAVEPPEGLTQGGIPVVVRGENLATDAFVTIGDVPLEDQVVIDGSTIEGTLPPSTAAGPADVKLEQGVESTVLPDGFIYRAHAIRIAAAEAAPGQTSAPVSLLVTSPAALSSVSLGFLFDETLMTIADITVEGTPAADAEIVTSDIDNAAGVATFNVVMRLGEATPALPAGEDVLLGNILADIASGAPPGARIALDIEDGIGSPPVELAFTEAGSSGQIRPLAIDGEMLVTEPAFLRGDANDDGFVDISDPITILNALFVGADSNPCADANDANDDGTVDISDGISLLLFLFQGTASIRPPYPDPGIDPTPDELVCGV
jgi:hypothetical protein